MNSVIANFKFEKLNVWQKAIDYSELIYFISKKFPPEEKFGLQSQIRRASVSVSLNIAEGSGKTTKKEFRKFLHDALGSLRETVSCLHLAKRLDYISQKNFDDSYRLSVEISKMLYRLGESLKDS